MKRVVSYIPATIRGKGRTNIASFFWSYRYQNSPAEDWVSLASDLGFPTWSFEDEHPAPLSVPSTVKLPTVQLEGRSGNVLASVCTLSHLPFSRTMIASVREHHPRQELPIYLLVVDWDGKETLDVPEATLLAGCDIGIESLDYLLLKFTAFEMCCAAKPFLLRYLVATTNFKALLYLDGDIYVFARLDHMLECLRDASLAVIPHTLAPLPNPERFNERPSLGDVIKAGNYNAGMFGLTITPDNIELLARWAYLVSAPGAFLKERGLQDEQHFFNWLVALSENVKVIKETPYNVAYWNLHDRSLRYSRFDQEEPNSSTMWKVDGKPLVAFHFSGFSPQHPQQLSVHDSRYEADFLPSITNLLEYYVDQLHTLGRLGDSNREYIYDRFPSGLPIPPDVREIFKKYEHILHSELSPWLPEGERFYVQNLLLPMPGTPSLLPLALFEIYELRHDLKAAFPNAHINPAPLLQWFRSSGRTDAPILYEYFNSHRPIVPKPAGLALIQDLQKRYADLFTDLQEPMGKDRTTLINRFVDCGLEHIGRMLIESDLEFFALSPIYLLWSFVADNPKIQREFPDVLFEDAQRFCDWFRENASVHGCNSRLADVFLQKAEGRSLARIFCFLNRQPGLAIQFPKALVGENTEAFAQCLLRLSEHDLEFDVDDIVMYLWTMKTKPRGGLPLVFELLVNACRQPSTLLTDGQYQLLDSLVTKPGFNEALNDYRLVARDKTLRQISARGFRRISVKQGRLEIVDSDRPFQRGVNLFGYFKSPTGLGTLSRGLARALCLHRVPVQENITGDVSMDTDLRPEDFIAVYDYSLDTNLFISFPHLQEHLLSIYPEEITKSRRNIVHLSWEQRDGYPSWKKDYADFDQIWAPSQFAAEAFRRYMQRDDVLAIPNPVDFSGLPQPATKSDLSLDLQKFIFLYVFDANSSIERKNPEAAMKAFAKAFSGNDSVQLLMKITNARRATHKERLRELADLAGKSSCNIHFLLENMPHVDVLRLLSAVDCYVSLHRSEGFGFTCAEAMAYARPVIATNYSATTEFMDSDSAFLVDYEECEVSKAEGPFQRGSVWAEPCIDHAAAQMRFVYLNQLRAQEIGLSGQQTVRKLLSCERVGRMAAEALAR